MAGPEEREPERRSEEQSASGEPSSTEAREKRRRFLVVLNTGLVTAGAALVGVPAIGVLVWPVGRLDTEEWVSLGAVDAFAVGGTRKVLYVRKGAMPYEGASAREGAWIRRVDEERFVAFSIYCTHTGCPVRWHESSQLFLCPCHGGAFDKDGEVASGPPPGPLMRHELRIRDGQLELRTRPIPHLGRMRES